MLLDYFSDLTLIGDIPQIIHFRISIAAGKAYLGMGAGWLIPVEIDSPHDSRPPFEFILPSYAR